MNIDVRYPKGTQLADFAVDPGVAITARNVLWQVRGAGSGSARAVQRGAGLPGDRAVRREV